MPCAIRSASANILVYHINDMTDLSAELERMTIEPVGASANDHASRELAAFAANLRYEDIPQPVLRRAEDFFLDWFGSALAGKGARPVETIERFAVTMGRSEERRVGKECRS